MQTKITIEGMGSNDTGICNCCGRNSRCVWGCAYAGGRCLAAYYVNWTVGHVPDQGANIDLILGEWGEAATAEHRSAVSLAYRLGDTGPSIMIINANTRPVSKNPLAGRAFGRDEILGTTYAQEAFTITDAVLGQDDRITEILGPWKIGA